MAEESTAFAAAGVLVELYRQAGVREIGEKVLPPKRSPKGLTHGQMVEAFVLLRAVGVESPEDMERLRHDGGLATLLGLGLDREDSQPVHIVRSEVVCVNHNTNDNRIDNPAASCYPERWGCLGLV